MIKRIALNNFRSLGPGFELDLGPLTALVGINGAGKSNVGDALRFMSECLREGVDTAVSRRNGINSLIRWSSGPPLNLIMRAEVSNDQVGGNWP
jgi:predicted ATPase